MVLFNHATREMTAKIVYYGPGLCGKTTNLLVIYDLLDESKRGKMLSLATKTDRTLFFDLLPVDVGKVGPFNLKIQLYTVPGQVFYNETRKLVLKGADAVVFVSDSQPSMVESNRQSYENLLENLQENQIDVNDIPIVIQYNKRDIPGVLSVEELQEKLGFDGYPYAEASAVKGEGVMETFKLVSKITAKHLIAKLQVKPGSKSEPLRDERKKEEKKPKKKTEVAPPPPLPEPAPYSSAIGDATVAVGNPFADSMPTADVTDEPSPFLNEPVETDYEKVEEVSLEELLEGRERPATFSGTTPVPMSFEDEEVDELPSDSMVATEPEPEIAFAVDEPAPSYAVDEVVGQAARDDGQLSSLPSASEGELALLRIELESLRREHEELKETLRRVATELTRFLG